MPAGLLSGFSAASFRGEVTPPERCGPDGCGTDSACTIDTQPAPQATSGSLNNECGCETCCEDAVPPTEGSVVCCKLLVTLDPVERSWPIHIGTSGPAEQPFHTQYSVSLGALPKDVKIIGAVVQYGIPVSGAGIRDDFGGSDANQVARWNGEGVKALNNAYPGSLIVNVEATWPTPPHTTTFSIGWFVVLYIDPHFPYIV